MMRLETARLSLRGFLPSDGAMLYAYLRDEDVVRYEPYGVFSLQSAEVEAVRRSNDPDFIAVCLPDGQLIGNLYLHRGDMDTWELGYVFSAKYQRRGYATEAARAALTEIFVHEHAHRVIAMCNPENTPSWRLMERLGMRREGHFLQNVFFARDAQDAPIWLDTYQYAILRSEFMSAQHA